MALGAPSPVEHPGRNLQEAVCLRTVQSAAKKHAIGLLDDRVNPHLVSKPGMMRVQNLTPDGLVGVLKPSCTTRSDRTRRSGWLSRPAAINRARATMPRPSLPSNTLRATSFAAFNRAVTSASLAEVSKSQRPSAASSSRSGQPHTMASSTSSSEPRGLQPSTSAPSTAGRKVSTMSPNTRPPCPRSEQQRWGGVGGGGSIGWNRCCGECRTTPHPRPLPATRNGAWREGRSGVSFRHHAVECHSQLGHGWRQPREQLESIGSLMDRKFAPGHHPGAPGLGGRQQRGPER